MDHRYSILEAHRACGQIVDHPSKSKGPARRFFPSLRCSTARRKNPRPQKPRTGHLLHTPCSRAARVPFYGVSVLSEFAVERAHAVTGGDAVLEEAASAERQADGLHVVYRHHEGFGDLQTVVASLAVPIRPLVRISDDRAYGCRPLVLGEQLHVGRVRPPELGVKAGRTGTGSTRCLRGREIKPDVGGVSAPVAILISK